MKPVLVICPDTIFCKALECNPHSLQHFTRDQDIPKVNIIKGRKNYQHVPVITGRCPSCQTTYSADHEQFRVDETFSNRLYINSARYLKVRQSTWVNQELSNSVLNGMYSFHASAAAYTEY